MLNLADRKFRAHYNKRLREIGVPAKACGVCHVVMSLGQFGKRAKSVDGRGSRCRECARAASAAWRAENPEYSARYYAKNAERYREYNARWYAENREYRREYNARWRSENAEHLREYNVKWRAENPEYYREYNARWRAANADKERERHARYYAENAERKLEYAARWRAENVDKVRERRARYYAENVDKEREAYARWRASNPEKVRAYSQRRRARKAKATIKPFTPNELLAAWDEAAIYTCHICDLPFGDNDEIHQEHIVPLAHGGTHEIANLLPAHARCNLSKGTGSALDAFRRITLAVYGAATLRAREAFIERHSA